MLLECVFVDIGGRRVFVLVESVGGWLSVCISSVVIGWRMDGYYYVKCAKNVTVQWSGPSPCPGVGVA